MTLSAPRVTPFLVFLFFLGMTAMLAFLDYRFTFIPRIVYHTDDVIEDNYVRKFDIVYNDTSRKIKQLLLWTGYFDTVSVWANSISNQFKRCDSECIVTTKREHLAFSDAVMFHDVDTEIKDLPGMRILRQPWILFTMEPSTLVKKNYRWMKGKFNWTVSYRNYSTILFPYGQYKVRTSDTNLKPVSLGGKNLTLFAIISNCYDAGKRFKLIEEIKNHLQVDIYGRCGMKCISKEGQCLPAELMSRYKFRIAFENSHCRNYVTEKYWSTLQSGSDIIPIVNWVEGQKSPTVIPGSYINVYDFNSIEDFATYINAVSINETLFQQYFEWRKHYSIDNTDLYCKICEKLHSSYQAQTYTNLMGWFTEDTCSKYSLLGMAGRWIDRKVFDIFN